MWHDPMRGRDCSFAAIVLWAYWRVALQSAPTKDLAPGPLLMLGATGLLYFHYFGALLLPALVRSFTCSSCARSAAGGSR